MDCDTAKALLGFRRPIGSPELAPDDLAALDRHLADCPTCANLARRAEQFDAVVQPAMVAIPIPPGLHDRLLRRDASHRAASFRRRVYQVAALAAAVLIAGFLGYGVHRANRPAFNTDDLAANLDQTTDAPERTVREWLKAQGFSQELPLDFDFRNYAFHGTEPLFGRDVPVIVFRTTRTGSPETLKLYLLRTTDFRLDGLVDTRGSFYTVRVLQDDRPKSGIVYLGVYNTPSLEPFLRRTVATQT